MGKALDVGVSCREGEPRLQKALLSSLMEPCHRSGVVRLDTLAGGEHPVKIVLHVGDALLSQPAIHTCSPLAIPTFVSRAGILHRPSENWRCSNHR